MHEEWLHTDDVINISLTYHNKIICFSVVYCAWHDGVFSIAFTLWITIWFGCLCVCAPATVTAERSGVCCVRVRWQSTYVANVDSCEWSPRWVTCSRVRECKHVWFVNDFWWQGCIKCSQTVFKWGLLSVLLIDKRRGNCRLNWPETAGVHIHRTFFHFTCQKRFSQENLNLRPQILSKPRDQRNVVISTNTGFWSEWAHPEWWTGDQSPLNDLRVCWYLWFVENFHSTFNDTIFFSASSKTIVHHR